MSIELRLLPIHSRSVNLSAPFTFKLVKTLALQFNTVRFWFWLTFKPGSSLFSHFNVSSAGTPVTCKKVSLLNLQFSSVRFLFWLTSKVVSSLSSQFNSVRLEKSSIPVKSVISLEGIIRVSTPDISAVKTSPLIIPSVSISRSISACSNLGSGILVVCA